MMSRWLIVLGLTPGATLQGSTVQTGTIAIRNVTVIPATGSTPITGATVVIAAGRIQQIERSAVQLPTGARIVDGTGKFLIPGLFEMHSHVSKARASALGLFVVNGVTTVRDMGGDHQELIRWRREVRAGGRIGPRLLIAGPYLESADNARRQWNTPREEMAEPVERTRIPVGSPADARRVVDSLAALELDHIKIRTVQSRAAWFEIVAAAKARGLSVVGHANAGPDVVVESGQRSVEHGFEPQRLDSLSREERMLLWRRLAAAGVGVVPTLVTVTESGSPAHSHLAAVVSDSLGQVEPRRRYLSRFLLVDWQEQLAEHNAARRAYFRRVWAPALRHLREMCEAGVRIMAGTDVGVLNIYPGFTLHDELAHFVALLGWSPAQAIEAATRQSAEFLGLADSVGTVETGKVADLLLLDADPLQAIRNTRRISAVVLGGKYFDRAALDSLFAAIESAPDRQVNDWPRP